MRGAACDNNLPLRYPAITALTPNGLGERRAREQTFRGKGSTPQKLDAVREVRKGGVARPAEGV